MTTERVGFISAYFVVSSTLFGKMSHLTANVRQTSVAYQTIISMTNAI
jgi:hypothetical protein